MVLLTLGICGAAAGTCGLGPYLTSFRKRRAENHKVKEFCQHPVQTLKGKRILAIVNPHGGNGTALDAYNRILQPMCKAAGVPVQLMETTHAGHARKIAQEAAATSSDIIIACLSGDGMLHDVVQGLIDEEQRMRLPVAVMPCGSSNGLAKSIYNSVDLVEAAASILLGAEQSVNLISATQIVSESTGTGHRRTEVGPEYDVVGLSHSIVVHAQVLAEIQLRWMNKLPMGGFLKDIMIALFEIGLLKTYLVKVQIQVAPLTAQDKREHFYTDPAAGKTCGKEWTKCQDPPSPTGGQLEWYEMEDNVVFCETVNVPWISYDMQLAPGLKLDERYMDLIISRGHSRSQLLSSFLKVEEGTHNQDPWFERYKVAQVAITPSHGNAFMMSGEFIDGFDGTDAKVLATCHDGHGRLWYRDVGPQ